MERFAPDERERNQLVAWVAEECALHAQSEWAIELFRYANQPARALRIISHLFSDRLEPALSEPASGDGALTRFPLYMDINSIRCKLTRADTWEMRHQVSWPGLCGPGTSPWSAGAWSLPALIECLADDEQRLSHPLSLVGCQAWVDCLSCPHSCSNIHGQRSH